MNFDDCEVLKSLIFNNYGLYEYCFYGDLDDHDLIVSWDRYNVKFYNHVKPPTYIILRDLMIKNHLVIDWSDQTFSFLKEIDVRHIMSDIWSYNDEGRRLIFGKFYPVPKATIPGKIFIKYLELVRAEYQDIMLQPYFGELA